MYKPTDQEKDQLKIMTNTPWWGVLVKAVSSMESDLLKSFKTMSIWDEDTLKKIHDTQNTLKGAEWVINIATSLSQKAVEKK
jgi:hypothetical protein